jgi:hypothetical protein
MNTNLITQIYDSQNQAITDGLVRAFVPGAVLLVLVGGVWLAVRMRRFINRYRD